MDPLPVRPAAADRPARYPWEYVGSHPETPTATTFRFSTRGTGFRYRSNQAVRLVLPGVVDPWGPARTFSLSSSPTETDVAAVTVKMTGSPFKEALRALAPGDRAVAIGPIGDLLYDPTRDSLFVAGGIGITPFRGMIRYASDRGDHRRIRLLYSARVPEELAFKAELDALARADPGVQVAYTITRPTEGGAAWEGPTGRIDEPRLRVALDGLERPKVFVVGLPEMAVQTLDVLRTRLGIDEADLEYEYFRGY